MLNVFRENLRHLKWVLLAVVASFILTIFAVWGGGVGRSDSPGSNGLWAARVDGRVIGVQAFQREARNLETTYRQVLGAQFDQQRSFLKMGHLAIDRLVDKELLAREARKAGLQVSEEEVAEAIMRDPSFQQNGVFIGRERYERLFRSNQLTITEYEREVQEELLLDKLRSLLEDSVVVSDAEVRDAFARQNEKITVQYLVLDPAKLGTATPSEAALSDFYRRHSADYSSGEGRSGRYVLFDARDIAAGMDVPESEVHSQYLQDQKTRYTIPEKRRASHILIKLPPNPGPEQVNAAEAKIKKALARVRSGEDFAKVAREISEDSTASAGGDLNFFPRDQMVREFADAVWALKVGQVSDPVRTPFGFHIIRLTDIQPGKELSLEEARPQILAQLKDARARAEAKRRAVEFVGKVRDSGGDLPKAAHTAGVVPKEFQGLHRGEAFPGLGTEMALASRLFALKPGDSSEPVAVAAGQVVLQFLSTAPPTPLPLEKVRERVSQDWIQDNRLQEAQKKLAAAGGTADLAAAARRLKVEVKSAGPVPKTGPLPDLGGDPALLDRLFALKPGEVVGPLTTPAGVAVVRLVSHSDAQEGFESQKETLRTSLLYAKKDRLFRAFLERLRAGSPVEINTTLVDEVDRT